MKETDKFKLQKVLPLGWVGGTFERLTKKILKCGRRGNSNGDVIESQASNDLDQAGCLCLSGHGLRTTLCTDLRIS